ncbi:MAG TPA: glycosyltransferase family 39 protein [Myxococcaceae bacterium]|nr:glycosyltransferase family 39 protein [Myxococcaceae bacterium]
MSARVRRRILFGLVGALYLLSFPYHPALRSPNELARLYMARAIVDFGRLSVGTGLCPDRFMRDPATVVGVWGPVGDLACFDGKFYSSKAPLLSFAAVPVYWVLRSFSGGTPASVPEIPHVFWSRFFLTVLPTLALLLLIWRFLRAYVSEEIADGLTATYALGSLAFSYSLLFMSHQTTAVLLFAAFYPLWRYFRGDYRLPWLLVTGAAAGASVMAEYTGAAAVLALAAYAVIGCWMGEGSLRERGLRLARVAGLVAVSSAPFLAALMAYHSVCFGGPLESAYKHLAQPEYQSWHLGGFLGIRFPDPSAFAMSFFSPLRGLFTLAPFLVLAIPGMVLLWRLPNGRPLFWLSALLIAGYAYFTSSFSYDSWGWTTGPRHLTTLVVFLLLPAGLALERARQKGPLASGLAAGLCAASVVVTGLITFVDYIPADVSNALFALAIPLFREGYLPPNVLGFIGLTNPASGVLLIAALAAAAALVLHALTGPWELGERWRPLAAPGIGLALCLAYVGLMAGLTRHDAADEGAYRLLRSSWLMPPGARVPFF